MTLLESSPEHSFFSPLDLNNPESIEHTRYQILNTSDQLRQGEIELSPEEHRQLGHLTLDVLTKPPLPDFERFQTASQILANLPPEEQTPELEAALMTILEESAQHAFPPQLAAEEVVAALYAIRHTNAKRAFPLALEQAHTKLGQSTEDIIIESQAVIRRHEEETRRQAASLDETSAYNNLVN